MEKQYTFSDLCHILEVLRGENGCPWDKVQTHESLREAMLEEAYEAVDAIDRKDHANLCEELGDVLLQVVFHANLAAEEGIFTMDDVLRGICEKMIYRHPHIFADAKADTPEEVLENWEALKKKEKHQTTQGQIMEAVPNALPALTRAKKIQKKAADVGFDFYSYGGAVEKVEEEWQEFLQEMGGEQKRLEEEFGDLLFAMVNVARFFKINPEFALTKATKKFINRFEYVENSVLSAGKSLESQTQEELDRLWEEAKVRLSQQQ